MSLRRRHPQAHSAPDSAVICTRRHPRTPSLPHSFVPYPIRDESLSTRHTKIVEHALDVAVPPQKCRQRQLPPPISPTTNRPPSHVTHQSSSSSSDHHETAGTQIDGTHDSSHGSTTITTLARPATLDGTIDHLHETWDTDLEAGLSFSSVSDDGIPSAHPHEEEAIVVPKPAVEGREAGKAISLWCNVRERARHDPLSAAGVVAAMIVLPFVVRGATR